ADTRFLSKRWLPLSTYIYSLDFNATNQLNEVALNPKLRKRYMKKYIRWIDRWLEFAVARQVQRLELDLLDGGDLPQYIGSCYNFPVQYFGLNDYDYSVLLFKSVNLNGEVVEFFIYNCPSLEELMVHASETFGKSSSRWSFRQVEILEYMVLYSTKITLNL
ncbi:hypothetical protein H5410_029904, partial [Solanum commersonii]